MLISVAIQIMNGKPSVSILPGKGCQGPGSTRSGNLAKTVWSLLVMQDTSKKNIAELFDDRQGMDRALARAIRRAVLNHKRTGNPVATWRDGKVVWLEPDEIEIPDDDI